MRRHQMNKYNILNEIIMRGCDCPNSDAIDTIPIADCPFDIKQVQKVVFQRNGHVFTADAIKLIATWNALKTASDSTKITSTPFIGGNPLITPGGAITEGGGDNSTLNGEEDVTGSNPSLFTCDFKSISPAQEKAIKKLMCEKNMQVYFITEENVIIANQEDLAEADSHKGFPISAFYFSDRDNQGFGKKDINKMRFSIKAGWSENIVKVKATDFSPLTYFGS